MATVDYVHDLAFPKLSDSEVEWLAGLATICSFKDGDLVFQAGQRGVPFYVVESGEIAIVDESTDESKTTSSTAARVHGRRLAVDRSPCRHLGLRQGRYKGLLRHPGRARRVIQEIPDLSDKLLEAFQTRRIMLERSGFVGVRVFGHLGDPALTEIREFFDKNKVPHTWVDADEPDGQAAMKSLEVTPDQLPFVSCNRGTRSPRPRSPGWPNALAEAPDTHRAVRPGDRRGRAGRPRGRRLRCLRGAVHYRPRPVRPGRPGWHQLADRELHGIPRRPYRADLANRGYLQALKFGAELVAPVEVRSMTCEDKTHRLVLDDGQVVSGRTVLIATGATYQRLPVTGCERSDGAGIFYSCTSVHARSCKNGRAAVVGGGNSAGQAAMFLADHTAGATLLLRGGDIRKSMSDYLARRIERHEKIEVIRHVEVDAVEGDRTLRGLRLRELREGGTRELDCSAVFVFIGAQPRTGWLPPSIAVDAKGFILTGADAARSDRWPLTNREPCTVETTCPGVFAAGDVRSNTTKRVAFAVGDGVWRSPARTGCSRSFDGREVRGGGEGVERVWQRCWIRFQAQSSSRENGQP